LIFVRLWRRRNSLCLETKDRTQNNENPETIDRARAANRRSRRRPNEFPKSPDAQFDSRGTRRRLSVDQYLATIGAAAPKWK
jgi:hypothetical protein